MSELFSDPLTSVFKALADPTRRRMLELLLNHELTLSELAEPFAMTLPAVLKHLNILAEAGLVDHRKAGRARHCRLEDGPLIDATVWLSRHCKYWQNQFDLLAALITTQTKGEKNVLRSQKNPDRSPRKANSRSARPTDRRSKKSGARKS